MVDRLLTTKIASAKKSILLLGPRQTGKSTLLRGLNPDLTINLANEQEFLRHSSDAELFESLISPPQIKTVLVDEIQRIPSLLNTIQSVLDEPQQKQRLRFLLSGSSARKLRRGQANLLPGRLFSYNLSGFAPKELNYKIDIKKALCHGLLPEPYLESDHSASCKLLESYSSTYLKEEIQAEALARDLQGFARFLVTIALRSGEVIDISKLATKSKVSRSSCTRFIEILEDTLIAERIASFQEAATADVIKHPKLYFFDIGVLNGLLNDFAITPSRIGNLFEHLVYSLIRNSAQAHDQKIEIYYFRTRHGIEVDLIVRIKNKYFAIEIKTGDVASADLNGLRAFREYFPAVSSCMVVSNKEKYRILDGITICGWQKMIEELGF